MPQFSKMFYIFGGQRGQDLLSKYSPSVKATVFKERKDRSCLEKKGGGIPLWSVAIPSSRKNKKILSRNSHQNKLCLTSILFADDDLIMLSFISRPWKRARQVWVFAQSVQFLSLSLSPHPTPPHPQSRAYSRWRGIRMNWFLSRRNVTCDENLWRDNKKIMVSMRHSYKRVWKANKHLPLEFG